MDEIIERSYLATVKRGLITERSTIRDFILKLNEETEEFKKHYRKTAQIDELEVADIILVCINMCRHFGIDVENALEDKIEINEKRRL